MAKRKTSSVKRKATFSHRDFLMYVLVFALVGAFALWVSFAAPHKSTGSGTLAGPVMVVDFNHDGLPNHKDTITYKVSTTATTTPEVGTRCYQGSKFVLDAYSGYFNSSIQGPNVTLNSGYWDASKAASCTGRLFYYNRHGRQVVLATLSYNVNP